MPPLSNNLRTAILGAAFVLAAGLVLSAFIGAYAFVSARSADQTLSVTGSEKKRVVSDSVKWVIVLSREVTEGNVPSGYRDIGRDLTSVTDFLKGKGLPSADITVSPPTVSESFFYDPSGSRGPRRFAVRQEVSVAGSEVARVTEVAKDASELADRGISFEARQPEYFYSKLSELRVELLSAAIRDAKARATEIARGSDRGVGKLKSASSGVVQVLAPNSIEVADYGQYDTSSVEKEVMVTVRATFFVR